jgi:SNF2 family DNA or RNA helicase
MSNRQRRKAVKGWVDDNCIGEIEESDDESLVQDSSIHQELQDLKGPSEKTYSRKSAIDDYDEYDYEDRVDDWLENGIASMRDMAEKDDEDERPGLSHFSGGLEIPAWINDKLFGYQRTGLRWLWELHLQEAGGIIGDEMVRNYMRDAEIATYIRLTIYVLFYIFRD